MFRAHFMRRAGIPAFLALAAVAVFTPGKAGALPIGAFDTDLGGTIYDPPASATVYGSVKLEDLPAVGTSVDIFADLKINSDGVIYPVGASTWSVVTRPTGSTSALVGTGLRRKLLLDRGGQFTVRVTACPSGCYAGGLTAPAKSFNLVINAVAQTPLAPEPWPPTFADRATAPTAIPGEDTKCQGGGAVVDPQWVTTSYFSGPSDYKLLEGSVNDSKVAGTDNLLNHHSHDWNMHVVPDAPFRNLLNANKNNTQIEIEWETNELPEVMRPTAKDRISTYGYQILDCGHGENGHYNTEIHPPVMWAVHRPRAFSVPSDQVIDLNRDGSATETLGSNVHIGGVITDVWVNAYSGEATDNDSITGLHQPSTDGSTSGAKINGPANIRRAYTFNVYLPKGPHVVAKEWGKPDAKAPPIYFSVKRHPNAPSSAPMGPMPTITPVTEGDHTYLRVTLDLSSYSGTKLAQQIEAGWVYPSPTNHGLEQWRLSVPKIAVKSSEDLIWGDWKFWLGDNGPSPQWNKIFDCSGCIKSDNTYYAGSSPWLGMSSGGQLTIAKLYPSQQLRLFATGFEDDNFWDNDLGELDVSVPKSNGYSSQASTSQYTAYYNVASLGAVASTLTSAAKALHDEYTLSGSSIVAPPPDTVAMFAAPIVVADNDEGGLKLVGGVDLTAAQASVAKAGTTKIDAVLQRLRTKIDARLLANPLARTRLIEGLKETSAAFPTAAWNARFSDLYLKP